MRLYTSKKTNSIIKKIVSETKSRVDYTDGYKFIINLIKTTPSISNKYDIDDYVPLNWEYITSIISSHSFKIIKDNLLRYNVVETDNRYVLGEKSKGYKLTGYYLGLIWNQDKNFVNEISSKVDSIANLRALEAISKGLGYEVSTKWSKLLKINVENSKKYVDRTKFDKDKKTIYKMRIDAIKDGDFFSSVDCTAGRLHTNLSSFPSKLRKYLTLGGEKMFQVDITNSQPTFLGLILKNNTRVAKEELDRYLNICKNGTFYEYLAENCGEKVDLKDYEVRSNFKKRVFTGVFFDRNRKEEGKELSVFKDSFPSIYREVKSMKYKNHNALAIALQTEEAKLIFKVIERAYNLLGANVPLTTIHDCVVSNEESIEKIREIMIEEFNKKYSFEPNLKCCEL